MAAFSHSNEDPRWRTSSEDRGPGLRHAASETAHSNGRCQEKSENASRRSCALETKPGVRQFDLFLFSKHLYSIYLVSGPLERTVPSLVLAPGEEGAAVTEEELRPCEVQPPGQGPSFPSKRWPSWPGAPRSRPAGSGRGWVLTGESTFLSRPAAAGAAPPVPFTSLHLTLQIPAQGSLLVRRPPRALSRGPLRASAAACSLVSPSSAGLSPLLATRKVVSASPVLGTGRASFVKTTCVE